LRNQAYRISKILRPIIRHFLLALVLLTGWWQVLPTQAHTGNDDLTENPDHQSIVQTVKLNNLSKNQVGVVELTGEKIPLDLGFIDENGKKVTLASIIDRPTLLLPVYFSCPAACPLQLGNLAQALNKVLQIPGKDYNVIALSFDDQDSPAYAKQAKKNYMHLLAADFPQEAWPFLVGDQESISKLTQAMGYSFQKLASHQFRHPNVLISLAADGKIIRYIYGPDFLPFDLTMAITEAENRTPTVSVRKLLTYCFSYDPENKRYVFNTFRVMGLSSFLIIGLFYLLVLRKGNRVKRDGMQ